MNKTNHHIYKAEQIDWGKLESVGISRSQIEKDENLDLLLQGEETNVMSIKNQDTCILTDHGCHTQSD